MTKTSQPGWHFQNFKPNCVEWKQSRYSPKQSGASSLAFFLLLFPPPKCARLAGRRIGTLPIWTQQSSLYCSGTGALESSLQANDNNNQKKKNKKWKSSAEVFFFFFSFLCQVCDASQRLAWLHYKQVVASSDWLAVGGEDRSSDTEV